MESALFSDKTLLEVSRLLKEQGKSISTAESCTGGLLGAALTSIPGSSAYYLGGVIAYDNSIKSSLLNVDGQILRDYGAVSHYTAEAMAEGVHKLTGSDISLSTTGIAGPGGGSEDKPAGLVYTGLYINGRISSNKYNFTGSREEIRNLTMLHAFKMLLKIFE